MVDLGFRPFAADDHEAHDADAASTRHLDPPWPSAVRDGPPRAVTSLVGPPGAATGTVLEHETLGRGGPAT